MKKTNFLLFALCVSLNLYAQKTIQLYEGKPKGSENWDWHEQTNFNPVFNAEEIANITQPTLLAYLPPKELATGAAVIIAPPGGFHILSVKSHGIEVAQWLNSKGVAVFVLKYRLARSLTNNPFQEMVSKDHKKMEEENATIMPLALADGLTAVKYIREHAKEMNIEADKIGFMGFSSGGALTMSVACNATDENRPNFLASIYGDGDACNESNIPKGKMPIFIAVAGDDPFGSVQLSMDIYKKWFAAKQPAELHIFEKGGHGFSLHKQNLPVDGWIDRFGDWLKVQGYLK